MQSTGKTFSKSNELLDGNSYSDCKFEDCRLFYRGGDVPAISGCHFQNCTWHFENAAQRTLIFLKLLYHGMGPNGAELVESALKEIREPMK